MRGDCRSGPKFLAAFSSFNKRRVSTRAEISGDFFSVCIQGARRSEPKPLAVFSNMNATSELEPLAIFASFNARRFSVRTEIPGGAP